MADRLSDPIGRLMGLRYKSHPWHGVQIGANAPREVVAFIEMVSTDTVKYEIDKESGYLKLDRPQKYSSLLPALYGFIPQTFCGNRVGKFCSEMINRPGIIGDGDPIDIVVLTEKTIAHGDILVDAKPIGGFRMIDGKEADDKIIAVMRNDVVYGNYEDVSELPEIVVKRLKHYFLTYKDLPGTAMLAEIPDTYGAEEAQKVIGLSMEDYSDRFDNLGSLLYGK
ncbi:MAG: inorganic pyrophosphatase [Prolixibacteraceae bacterium]|nr:inorganic pyrophosphatase [Prolixibacteraceae bacterium]